MCSSEKWHAVVENMEKFVAGARLYPSTPLNIDSYLRYFASNDVEVKVVYIAH